MTLLFQILLLIFYLYLAFATVYLLVFAFSGLFSIPHSKVQVKKKRKMAVLIPGYKEDNVILEVARQALKQEYGKEYYDVIIIADGFQKTTIQKLRELDVIVFEVELEFSTKSRALNAALNRLDDRYDVGVILDADNLMAPDFLDKINEAFCKKYIAVQGHRIAKNVDTAFAILDAVSEEMNNHIFRKGHRILGLSSALIGSAMAFDYNYLKVTMQEVEVVGGFDKELEIRLLSKNKKVEYVPDAYVFDEKVPNAKVFTKQRRRWLGAQIHYFGKSFIPSLKMLFRQGNIDYFNKALQFILPPRIMLITASFLMAIVSLIFNLYPGFYLWFSVFVLGLLVFFLSIPGYFYNLRTLWALSRLPLGIVMIFLSLFRMRGKKEYLHTKHTYNAFQIKHPLRKPPKRKSEAKN
ncbi:MAG: glycosyltransferase [Bacteroidales bacterium]|nr:glycosyltransferase [Bacteroidales bacterium]